jgi:predicted RNA binding protein YcfA (HicA-like mRNA interferase family)
VPAHSGETIGPGLLRKILRDCQLSVDELRQLL